MMPFGRHVSRALLRGALRSYFWREEHYSIYTLADLAASPPAHGRFRNQAEQGILTRDLLKQVTGFPNFRPDA